MSSDLHRHTFEDGRIYVDGDQYYPSVSTVLDVREKPPGLKNYFDRTTEDQRRDKSFYTQNRGTLIHYKLLDQLTDREMWSEDEQSSRDQLKGNEHNEELDRTGGLDMWERYQRDEEWALETWDLIRNIYNIHPENTLNVELFVTNSDVGYAGQFDLLYEDDGDVVLADLKTSKWVYDKHLIQLSAYMHAVDVVVDRMEVIRLNPDSERWEISRSDEWAEDPDDLWEEFVDLRAEFADEKLEELTERAQNA